MPRSGVDALPLADRTVGTHESGDIGVPHWARGMLVMTERTAGTGTMTITIRGKDPASSYYTILGSAAAQTVSRMQVYPGGVVTANLAADAILPEFFKMSVAVATANATFVCRVIFTT